MNKAIIYGTGQDAKECLDFLGCGNVCCFVSDVCPEEGDIFADHPLIGPNTLANELSKTSIGDKKNFDVIIAVDKRDIFCQINIANRLDKIGCNYSVWHDIKKRWHPPISFLARNLAEIPYERETILEIRNAQLAYLQKHANSTTLEKATGELRSIQVATIKKVCDFLELAEDDKIQLSMFGGTLIGALRHKGYIPWDDDIDFSIPISEYMLLIDKLEQCSLTQVFYHAGYENHGGTAKPVFKTKNGSVHLNQNARYFCRVGYGYLKIYKNSQNTNILENESVCDIFPLYYFSNSYTQTEYHKDIDLFYKRRKTDLFNTDRDYLAEMKKKGSICEKSAIIGCGHPHITSLMHWFPGAFSRPGLAKASNYLPLQKMEFEDKMFWAPANPEHFLHDLGCRDWQSLPANLPFDHHCREIAPKFESMTEILSHIIDAKG